MAFVRIPAFQQSMPVVDKDGRFTAAALRSLNDAFKTLGQALNTLAQIPEIQAALANLDAATQAALDAAAAAQGATDAQKRETSLQSSYIDPTTALTANSTTITIAPHTRYYGDGTSVPVNGGTVPVTAAGDVDYVYYDDPSRAGGSVTYQVATVQPVQTGDRHVVGAVEIPTTGTVDGGEGPSPPGKVIPKYASML